MSRATRGIGSKGIVGLAIGLLVLGALLLWRFGSLPGSAGSSRSAADVPQVATDRMEKRVVDRIETTRRALLADLRSAAAWGQYGIVLDAHDLDDAAIICYRHARQLDPKEFRWTYFLARTIEFSGGIDEESEGLYREAASQRPRYAPLWVRLGDNLVRQGKTDDARIAFRTALDLDPGLAKAHRGLGQTYLNAEGAEESILHLERATQLLPADGAAWASLARAYSLAGDRPRARDAAERSRSLDQIHTFPDPVTLEVGNAGVGASICFRRARELMDLGDFRNAIPNLLIARESLDQNARIPARLGRCYLETGRTDLAERELLAALELDATMADVLAQLGALRAQQARFPEAIDFYRRAIAQKPVEAKTVALLASALAQSGDLDGATTEFERANGLGPLDAVDQNNWGTALAQRGALEPARAHFAEAVRLDPDFANARFNLGITLEQLGQVSAAMTHYRVVAGRDPRHRAARRLAALEAASRER